MALGHLYWDQEELFGGKNRVQNYRETVPLKGLSHQIFCVFFALRLCPMSGLEKEVTSSGF